MTKHRLHLLKDCVSHGVLHLCKYPFSPIPSCANTAFHGSACRVVVSSTTCMDKSGATSAHKVVETESVSPHTQSHPIHVLRLPTSKPERSHKTISSTWSRKTSDVCSFRRCANEGSIRFDPDPEHPVQCHFTCPHHFISTRASWQAGLPGRRAAAALVLELLAAASEWKWAAAECGLAGRAAAGSAPYMAATPRSASWRPGNPPDPQSAAKTRHE